MNDRIPGTPPFPNLRYCTRCCMPETNEGMQFDELGVCLACRSSEEKMRLDWTLREKALREILDEAKRVAGDNYDCIVPISGGKDSAFQLHVLTRVYDCNPLAVTFSHNWYSKTGWENLWNVVERLNVDHIMYTPKRSLVNRMARKSLPLIGDSCWHCHQGIMAFPLQCAVRFNVKLIIWGESPADFSGRDTYFDQKITMGTAADYADLVLKHCSRNGPEDMIGDDIKAAEMRLLQTPSREELVGADIKSIWLGDHIYWDGERQTEFLIREYGWKEDKVEGTYKRYKSVECQMPGVHDYSKFVKRGFGRATDFVSQDVRAGLMTREDGFDIAAELDAKRPEALDKYLEITGYSEDEFYEILRAKREGKAKELP